MNGDDQHYAGKIRRYLDQGAADLRPGIAYRLQQARAAALARLSGETETAQGGAFVGAPSLAGAGGPAIGGSRPGRPLYAQARTWLVLLILAAAAFGWRQWSTWQELEALEDLDAQLLTSDLPIDAYLDRGFQTWLKTPPPPSE